MSKSPSLRRIQADIRELALDPSDQYFAAPLENDMFEWHFTIRGAEGTDFEGGIYHGRILLPAEYPYKPPHIMFLTPSGRFETNTKVCLSFSAYHPELWQPAWGIRLILEALISFLPTPGDGAIGALDYKPSERKRLAKASQTWSCPTCGRIASLLPTVDDPATRKQNQSATNGGRGGKRSSAFSKEIRELQRLQQQTEGGVLRTKKKAAEDTAAGDRAAAPTLVEEKPKKQTEEPPIDGDDSNNACSHETVVEKAATTATTGENECGTNPSTTIDETNGKAAFGDEQLPAQQQQEPNKIEPEPAATAAPADPASGGGGDAYETAADFAPADSLSKLADPLVTVSILLMICICILLCQKGVDLSRELRQLQATPLVVEQGLAAAAGQAAASSVAAAAAASEEL